jgi:hypothetical protein
MLYSSNLLLGFPTGRSFTSSTTRQQNINKFSGIIQHRAITSKADIRAGAVTKAGASKGKDIRKWEQVNKSKKHESKV